MFIQTKSRKITIFSEISMFFLCDFVHIFYLSNQYLSNLAINQIPYKHSLSVWWSYQVESTSNEQNADNDKGIHTHTCMCHNNDADSLWTSWNQSNEQKRETIMPKPFITFATSCSEYEMKHELSYLLAPPWLD